MSAGKTLALVAPWAAVAVVGIFVGPFTCIIVGLFAVASNVVVAESIIE